MDLFIIVVWSVLSLIILMAIVLNLPPNKSNAFHYNLSRVDSMSGTEFEFFCKRLLEELGFEQVSRTPASGDYGIDLIASLGGVKYGIQCKRYQKNVGVKAVSETVGGLSHWGCRRGMVITNSRFTKNAVTLANDNQVILHDRDWLIMQIQRISKAKQQSAAKEQELPALLYKQIADWSDTDWSDFMAGKISAIIPPGRYVIGTDIPCGKYDVLAHNGNGRVSLFSPDENTMKVNASIGYIHDMYYTAEFKGLDCKQGDVLLVELAEVKLILTRQIVFSEE